MRFPRPVALLSAFCSAAVLSVLAGVQALAAQAPEGTVYSQVTVASTTDLHGHIYPIDYYSNRPEQLGLAKISTVLSKVRLGAPNLILIDCGDTIQGTPLEYYHNRIDNQPVDPMMLVMSALRYDAMVVGNHDYNFGLKVQQKAHAEAKFPWLSANTYKTGTDENAFQPYLVREVNGVRVGILGITTPAIPNWENVPNYAGLEFRDSVSEARKWVAVLKGRERADVVVVAVHMGLERDLATGERPPRQPLNENNAIAIAQEVPGVDLMLLGHTHRDIPSVTINGVLMTQAGRWGDRLARADLYMSRAPGGPWQVWAKSAQTIPITASVQADTDILHLAESYHTAAQAWLDRKIGECAKDLSAADARLRDTAIIDLVQRAQMEAGNADVSLTSVFNPAARIRRGPVTVRDICGIYVYENTLAVVEVTGRQLKDTLEHSAKFFLPYEPGKTAGELMDGRIPGYNFDTAAGVSYVVDLTRPPGDRIRDLSFHGSALDPDRKLRLATNNYRLNGGGGYEVLKNAPVVYRSSEEIRDLVIEWVERHHEIPSEPLNNWRIIP